MSQPLTLANLREQFKKSLNDNNYATNSIKTIEQKTGVDREYIAYGIIGFVAFYLCIGWGNDFLCNLIGFAWPAYASIKAIESTSCQKDDTKWLMYWVVYALFGLMEFFGDHLLFWIPFYTLTKCLFLLWLMVPGANGGTFVMYYRIIKPFFLKHESKIDQAVEKAKDTIGNSLNKVVDSAAQKLE